MEMTCPGLDFCENIQCFLCTSVILNPECWPIGALVGLTILIYMSVALVYVVSYVSLTIGKPIRLICRATVLIMRYVFQIWLHLLRFVLQRSVSARENRRLRRLAEAIAILTILHQVVALSQGCQDVNTFLVRSNICTLTDSLDTCEITVSNILKINPFKREARLRLYANQTLLYISKFVERDFSYSNFTKPFFTHATLDCKYLT